MSDKDETGGLPKHYLQAKWGEKPRTHCGNCEHSWHAFDADGNGPEPTCVLNQSHYRDPFFGKDANTECEKWEPPDSMIDVPENQEAQ